ncbi:hypothetical protein FH972_023279 [Carpinus fangiana]|uniref:Major facilitator superfamily (MFS) profile domain-containing protein n=1 Tax=Carpinus fangiana TaxID=176857 RepID=A0A5N6KV21_9ROSI|nr:hypothetical protein FH972_023279 [Carpinus fangiana]
MRAGATSLVERVQNAVDSPPIDGEYSINGLLVNPFAGKSREEMDYMIKNFMAVTQIDSHSTDLFCKGALLAQNSDAFKDGELDGMSLRPEEQRALKAEGPDGNKWDQPGILYALVACCSMGAAVQGWDETAVNQAQIYYGPSLGLGGDDLHPSFRLGLLNSAPYLCCAVLGCWLTDPMNHYLGRRGTIFVSCLISSLSCLWQGFTNTWWHMFIARLALGLGIGPKSATVPVYAAESTPKQIRGALVMMWQTWTAFGIMLGYISGVVFRDVKEDLNWRLIIASPCVLPLVVCAYVYTLPESPRWLLAKARRSRGDGSKYYQKSFDSLRRLRKTPLQAARDMILIYYSLENEISIKKQRNRFIEMFSVPRNRRGLQASSLVMFLQQFCGVNVLAYYSSLVFQIAGYTKPDAALASMGFGIINFVFALPAFYTIDSFGRRNLLLCTFPLMAIFQLLTGLAFLAPDKSMGRKVLVTVGMYLFSVAYSPGEGPVPFLYSSESMPLYVRDLGMSLFTAVTWLFNFILSITFPPFLEAFGLTGTFGYYAAWCVVGFFGILLIVPETANQTLEELDARFSIPTRKHSVYGLKQLRWCFMRFVLFRKCEKPEIDVEVSIPGNSTGTGRSSSMMPSAAGHGTFIGPGGNAPTLVVRRKFNPRANTNRHGSVETYSLDQV